MQFAIPDIFSTYRCVQCGEACKYWFVEVNSEEESAILEKLEEISDQRPLNCGFDHYEHEGENRIFLRQSGEGCSFLQENKLCYLHNVLDYHTKPNVCRSYPFYAIQTPEIIFVNATLSCTSIRQALLNDSFSCKTISDSFSFDYFIKADLAEKPSVRMTSMQTTGWQGFYFLQKELYRIPSSKLYSVLDMLWLKVKECRHQYLSVEWLQEILEQTPQDSCPDDVAHLSTMITAFRHCLWELDEGKGVWLSLLHLFDHLKIDIVNVNSKASSNYRKYFLTQISNWQLSCRKILANYVRTYLFINEFYFSRSFLEALEITSLMAGMACLLAIANSGYGGPVSQEHLLDAIYVIEKYFFHSGRFENFPAINVRPSLLAAPDNPALMLA